MKETLEALYPYNACLLGEGFDKRLDIIKSKYDLEVIEVPSGTQIGTWTVPDEWIVRDAWVKDPQGNKIADFSINPLSLVVGSIPMHATVSLEELRTHWNYSDDLPDATPYVFKYYDKDWGFCFPKNAIREKVVYHENGEIVCEGGTCFPDLKDFDPEVGKVQIEGIDYKPQYKDKLVEGDYEVFIDTEYRPGTMKIGVHTIPGNSDREILLFAHLDHPYQANDNLSAVVCLLDLVEKLDCDHTIKIVFCAETIGSIAYVQYADISKVDFMISVDICGNDNPLLLQKPWDVENRLYRVSHVAIQGLGETYRQGQFRNIIGSDEYVFNDPMIGIPGIMLSRFPYKEYHTSADSPEIINYDAIEKTGLAIQKIIEVYEKDFIPKRETKFPLMRSRYGMQTANQQVNLSFDYFWYAMDGKRSLAELCCEFGLNFEYTYDCLIKMENDGVITRKICTKN